MSSEPHELVLERLFAPARGLEFTEPEVRAVMERVSAPRARGHRGLRLPRVGTVISSLAAGSAVAIAVLAIVLLGHRAPTTSAGAPAGARQLTARLAVLRRPQATADRISPSSASRLLVPGVLVPSLTRFIDKLNIRSFGEVEVYLIVTAPTGRGRTSPAWNPKLGDRVGLIMVPTNPAHAIPAGLGELASQLTPSMIPRGSVPGFTATIVPDGVAHVRWAITAGSRRTVLYPTVHDNVAVWRARLLPGQLSEATWYGRSGNVVAKANLAAERARLQRVAAQVDEREVARSAKTPIAPALLRYFALFRSVPPTGVRTLPLDVQASTAQEGNAALTRHLRWAGIWVIPGTRTVCMQITWAVCAQATGPHSALEGGPFMLGGSRRQTIIGFVPDDNTHVEIRLTNGSIETAPVTDNIFAVTVPGQIHSVTLKTATGQPRTAQFAPLAR
jgi:hypothetical protein